MKWNNRMLTIPGGLGSVCHILTRSCVKWNNRMLTIPGGLGSVSHPDQELCEME